MKLRLHALALLLILPGSAFAVTIVPAEGSLFRDHAAHEVGDIVTVLIVESSSASKATLTRTKSRSQNALSSLGKLDFMGMWNLNADNQSLGEGSTARRGDLQARITVEITDVTASGLLLVSGDRSVLVNGEEEKIHLSGTLRPQDIQADNTVFSTFLANAAIEYTGEGVLASAERPGYFTRFFNWLF